MPRERRESSLVPSSSSDAFVFRIGNKWGADFCRVVAHTLLPRSSEKRAAEDILRSAAALPPGAQTKLGPITSSTSANARGCIRIEKDESETVDSNRAISFRAPLEVSRRSSAVRD